MKILALDTSTTSGSIALVSNGSLVSEWNVGTAGAHARWLLKSISNMLDATGTRIGDVDLIALATGPGSFTGLRIGVSVAKGLAWGTGAGVVGVSTLEAMAMNAPSPGTVVCPVLDARRQEVYGAVYSMGKDGSAGPVLADMASAPERFAESVAEATEGRPLMLLGSGIATYGALFRSALPASTIAAENLWHARATNVAAIAERMRDHAVTPSELAPLYLRRSVAEEKLDQDSPD